jgi:catechol 2,3-dioxygenase-like lactoylglutathione lyase family enzyme
MKLNGLHHITAMAGDPQRNVDFYVGVLGLRLIKKTVNFDDPGTYHLYYGDNVGTPGTIVTFFPWPGARQGHPGAGQATKISFQVHRGSFAFWSERLTKRVSISPSLASGLAEFICNSMIRMASPWKLWKAKRRAPFNPGLGAMFRLSTRSPDLTE